MQSEVVFERNGSFERELEQATRRGLQEAAKVGLAAVRATPTGYHIESILDAVIATGVERTEQGLGVWLVAGDWRSLFFERGTYKRRRGKLSPKTVARRATPSGQRRMAASAGNRGVKAAFFLRHGGRAAMAALPELLERECSRMR